MLKTGESAPAFTLHSLAGATQAYPAPGGKPTLLAFFETDCPTCALAFPYLNRLAQTLGEPAAVLGISQDDEPSTRSFAERLRIAFPLLLDQDWQVSRQYDPLAVPTLFLLDSAGKVARTVTAFDKDELNELTAELCRLLNREPFVLAEKYDGAPAAKPGCTSRHLEPATDNGIAASLLEPATDNELSYNSHNSHNSQNAQRATRIELAADIDDAEYCLTHGFDPLPIIPPTLERVERMLQAAALYSSHNSYNSQDTPTQPHDVIALVPPNYGQATIEKIAANAVMAGCQPEMLRVLIPLLRAACDERFNLHGVQATTHFAAPLIIINGPVRHELNFACGSNVFSNVARANSTLGRALQLILTNIGGARPGEYEFDKVNVTINRTDVTFAANLNSALWVSEQTAAANPTNIRFVKVALQNHAVKVYFVKPFLNTETVNLRKTATAGLATAGMNGDTGPNTICEWVPLAPIQDAATSMPLGLTGSCPRTDIFYPGCTYIIRSGSGGHNNGSVSPGNYQILCGSMDNCGGSAVSDMLAGGFKICRHPGDQVKTKTGVAAGPVRQGLNTRFGHSSTSAYPSDTNIKEGITYAQYKSGLSQYTQAPSGNTPSAPNRRVIILPIVNDNEFDNGRDSVKIHSFGAFFMQNKVPGGNGGDITAEYIGHHVFFGDPRWDPTFTPPQGAGTIKLISAPILYQ